MFSPSKNDLLQAFQSGEEKGFAFFFRAFYRPLCFFANRYVRDMQLAEDIVEESFILVWNKREKMETEAGLRGYLYKTVYHGCLRWLENEERRVKHLEEYRKVKVENEVEEYERNLIRTETLRLVHESMEQLPEQCRKVFVKLFIEGKSVKEAAEELRVTVSTINNQKARGVRLLRMRLGLGFVVFSLWFVV